MSSSKRNSSQAGFMLLEVVLSVLLIASGLVVVVRSYSTSLRASQVASGLSKACLFLEDRLFDIDVQGFRDALREEGLEAEGIIEDEPGYRWNLSLFQLDEDKKTRVCTVDLKMFWKRHAIDIATIRKYQEE